LQNKNNVTVGLF